MRESTISRNYAEILLELARRENDLSGWGELIDQVADAVQRDKALHAFMDSPRVGAAEKNRIIVKAFQGHLPPKFLRFLETLVSNRRQMLLSEIAREYHSLLDEAEGRVHASVTTAHDVDESERDAIAKRLSKAFGKEVVAHYQVNPELMGGVLVRVGDMVLDGSVRRKLATLRARMVR